MRIHFKLYNLLRVLDELIGGCLNNDVRAQKILYEQYYGYCLKIVFRYVYRYDTAVDVVNDGFIKIFTKLHRFNFDKTSNIEMSFMGWVKKIMINTSIDRLRKDNFLPEIGLISDNIWIEDKTSSADQALLYKELINEIKKLPPAYRIVFNMFVIDGLSHLDISKQLNIAVGTSKSNLSKARIILQSFIKKADHGKICYM